MEDEVNKQCFAKGENRIINNIARIKNNILGYCHKKSPYICIINYSLSAKYPVSVLQFKTNASFAI